MRYALLPFILAVAVLFSPGSAHAAPIQYNLTNVGGNTWEYSYYITDAFLSRQGFRVYFDDQDTSNLTLLPPITVDWDVLLTDPEPVLQSDGTYDALALADNPLFTGPFSMSFLWTGVGNPGAQTYDFYTLDVPVFNLVRETMPAIIVEGFRGVINTTAITSCPNSSAASSSTTRWRTCRRAASPKPIRRSTSTAGMRPRRPRRSSTC